MPCDNQTVYSRPIYNRIHVLLFEAHTRGWRSRVSRAATGKWCHLSSQEKIYNVKCSAWMQLHGLGIEGNTATSARTFICLWHFNFTWAQLSEQHFVASYTFSQLGNRKGAFYRGQISQVDVTSCVVSFSSKGNHVKNSITSNLLVLIKSCMQLVGWNYL